MELIQGNVSRSLNLDFNIVLYRVNDEIYDEIIFEDGKYYLIRRCAVEKYSVLHQHEVYATDMDILIYPLPENEIVSEEISANILKSYSEITSISIVNGQYTHTQFSFAIDKSKREYVDYYCGDDITFDMEHMDTNRESYVYRIKNNLPHEKVDIDTIHYNKRLEPNLIIDLSAYVARDTLSKIYPLTYLENNEYILPIVDTGNKKLNIRLQTHMYGISELQSGDKIYRQFNTSGIPTKWVLEKNIGTYTLKNTTGLVLEDSQNGYNIFALNLATKYVNGRVNILSDRLSSVTSLINQTNECVYCDGSKVYLYLSASTYTSVSDVHANLDGTEFYYVLSAPQYYDVINQYDLHNLSMRQLKIGKELSVKDTEISVQVDYSQSFYYTESSMFDVLPNNTVKIAYENDHIVLRYYDINGNILGFSDIMVENGIYTIPNNVYYVSIMDLECYEQYQYSFKDDAGVSNGDIEDLFLTVDNVETEIALPHILHPGDELYYDIDHEVWTYYPRSANGMYIVYDDFAKIAINGNISCQEGLILGACVSCISIRNLERPDNIIIYDDPHTGDFGFGYVTFDEVAGATSYDIYINDEFVENFENADDIERFDFESEQKGDLYIVAKNDDAESVNSKEKYIVTVPNTPILGSVDTIYENNRYYITIQFNANSRIANTYDVIYSLDGSNEVTEVMVHDKVYNSSKTFTFTAPTITDSFTVLLAASNETGRNDYQSSVTLVTNSGFDIWTYKKNDNHVLMAWTDEFTDEDGYILKYSINNGEWQTYISDGDIGSGNRLSEYIPLGQNETMRICLAVLRNGYTNIYSRPIVVSMALDTTLLPPANFTGTKTDSGNIQFSWEDNYDVDIDYFELYYIYSDGDTQTVQISRQSEIAGNYTYVYSSDQYGFIQAKIKMVWELGESDYTQNLIIYNIPTVETAPSLTSKSRTENRLKITWEIYDYIQKYTLYLTVNGEQEVINTNDNEYYYNIPMDQSVISVNVAVQATFIDGSYTNISDSLSFNICNSSYEYRSVIYTHNEDEHKLYTTMLSRGLYTSYRDYMISTNKYTIEYPYIEKIYLRYLFRDYILHEMYWGHNVGASYFDNVLIVNSSMQTYNINVKIYTKETLDNRLLSILYSKCENSYPIYTSITKLIIACFGDSITAGHPNYWAKFNPYVEKSA